MLLLNVQAQDFFSSIEEMLGKEFRIYPLSTPSVSISDILFYKTSKGKFKSLKNTNFNYASLYDKDFKAVQIVIVKKKRYLEFTNSRLSSLYFLIDKNKDFSSCLRSVTYWKEKLDHYSEKCAYLDINNFLFEGPSKEFSCISGNDKYVSVHWIEFKMPEAKDRNGEVLFRYSVCGVEKEISNQFLEEKESVSFIDQKQFDTYLIQYRKQLAAQEYKDSLEDYTLIEATLSGDFTYMDSENKETTIDFGTTLPIYKIEKDEAYTIFLRNEVSVPLSALVFQDSLKKSFLEKRGDKGLEVRKQLVSQKDLVYTEYVIDQLDQEISKIEKQISARLKDFNRKEIFLLLQKYSYSDSRFGLKFRFYNCFKKAIKYIHITIRPYNQVYDIQRDYIGRTVANVRCIGPLFSGEQADFDFDELFWDENDVIRYLYVTNIKFIFMDNTTRVFSGKKVIDAHRCKICGDDEF